MWKQKKKSDIYHEEVIETNSSDIIDGIDLLLNTTSYDFQSSTLLPWQDISRIQTSPNECRFEAYIRIPQKLLFADAPNAIEVKIGVTQADRFSEVRVSFGSKSKRTIWTMHAAKDLMDKISAVCGPSPSTRMTAKTEGASSIRMIGDTLVMDLQSKHTTQKIDVGLSETSLKVLNLVATAVPQSSGSSGSSGSAANPPFALSELRIQEMVRLVDSMVLRHLAASKTRLENNSTYVPIGYQRTFVDVLNSHRASFGLGLVFKEIWVVYEYVSNSKK